jgi:hypothetical protein
MTPGSPRHRFAERSRPHPAPRRPGPIRGLAARILLGCCSGLAIGAEATPPQAPAAESGRRDVHAIAWLPDAFTDYLATGQTPRPAVARIVAPDAGGTSVGSGVLVDANASQALVLTNAHVVRECRGAVLVQFADGFQSAGTVLRKDEAWDLAAIVIWRPEIQPLPIARSLPAVGEPLTIAGYGRGPYREQSGPCTQYLSPGSGLPNELVELAATARQGDSGGPILNGRGEVAGILFGEGDGRTIGAAASRVRGFLKEVGSVGFDPMLVATASGPPGPGHPTHAQPPFAAMPPLAQAAALQPWQIPSAPASQPPTAVLQAGSVAIAAEGSPFDLPDDPAEAARMALAAAGAVSLAILGLRALASSPSAP